MRSWWVIPNAGWFLEGLKVAPTVEPLLGKRGYREFQALTVVFGGVLYAEQLDQVPPQPAPHWMTHLYSVIILILVRTFPSIRRDWTTSNNAPNQVQISVKFRELFLHLLLHLLRVSQTSWRSDEPYLTFHNVSKECLSSKPITFVQRIHRLKENKGVIMCKKRIFGKSKKCSGPCDDWGPDTFLSFR